MADTTRYLRPGGLTGLFNRVVATATGLGLSVRGSRVLRVRGRRSGEWRATPVNPLPLDGRRYLVAPRGTTEWVRNRPAAGGGELVIGRRVQRFTATEVADADKPAVLRAYLRHWRMEVGAFFDGIGPEAGDAELLRIAPGYPVFRIEPGS